MAHGAAEHKVCVVHGRGSQRARWGHLGPGHLGAQGASMVRVVDYCNEQIQPNPPEKSQITPAQRPRPWPPGFVPCRCPSSQGVVLSAGAAVPWRGSARRHKGCPGQPVLQRSRSVLGRGLCRAGPGWAGMPPVSSAAAAGLAGRLCRAPGAARLLPARLKGWRPGHQHGPGLFTLDFLLLMHKAQCGVRGCPWKETEEASKLFSMVNIYTNIILKV